MTRFGSTLLLVLILAFGPGCAIGMAPTVVAPVQQRHALDCLVAAVAMLIDRPYDDVELARLVLDIPFGTAGMTVANGLKIMAALGKPGEYRAAPSLTAVPTPRGILIVSTPGYDRAHAVVIDHRGLIYDPAMSYATAWILWFADRPTARVDGIVVMR